MSERKVLSKSYPPDFDPRQLERQQTRGAKGLGPRSQPVRLMAPFAMRCSACGEYIGKGRKFNAQKETLDEKYLNIQIYRFYIRCTRCSAEITFKPDPKLSDYTCERGATRNTEPWRTDVDADETVEARLDRLEEEERQQGEEPDAMKQLEEWTSSAQTQMAVADALDEVGSRNARLDRIRRGGQDAVGTFTSDEAAREDEQDREEARRAFATHTRTTDETDDPSDSATARSSIPAENTFQPTRRRPKQPKILAGLKVKEVES